MSDDGTNFFYVKKPLFGTHRGHIYNSMIDKKSPLNKTVVTIYWWDFLGVGVFV
jgi:hypothetical protein